jgi:hypothetical protein
MDICGSQSLCLGSDSSSLRKSEDPGEPNTKHQRSKLNPHDGTSRLDRCLTPQLNPRPAWHRRNSGLEQLEKVLLPLLKDSEFAL